MLLGKIVFEIGTHTCARTHKRKRKNETKKGEEKRKRRELRLGTVDR